MDKMKVIIIGAGPAGLSAAYHILKTCGNSAKVTVIEHKDKPGKKLLATGNGRCNFTNDVWDDESYRGTNSDLAYALVKKYDKEWILGFMREIGIIAANINGYYYPRALSANVVNDALINNIISLGGKIITKTHVNKITKSAETYSIYTDNGRFDTDFVVLSTGGRSYSKLGSDGSGYTLAKSLGHSIRSTVPALCGLYVSDDLITRIKGVRSKGTIKIISDKKTLSESTGEIQFTEYGLSGIPVFQVSRYAAYELKNKKNVSAAIDLCPEYSYEELLEIVTELDSKNNNINDMLSGLINPKLASYVVNRSYNRNYSHEELIENICRVMKNLTFDITDTMDYENAQVTAGGIMVNEIDSESFESNINKGLYIAGELLDIDGNCGGYNLHFAFASGAACGVHIGGTINGN